MPFNLVIHFLPFGGQHRALYMLGKALYHLASLPTFTMPFWKWDIQGQNAILSRSQAQLLLVLWLLYPNSYIILLLNIWFEHLVCARPWVWCSLEHWEGTDSYSIPRELIVMEGVVVWIRKTPHRFRCLNTCSPVDVLFGKVIEFLGKELGWRKPAMSLRVVFESL